MTAPTVRTREAFLERMRRAGVANPPPVRTPGAGVLIASEAAEWDGLRREVNSALLRNY